MKGRKRHIVVDGLELVLGCYVSAANVADVEATPAVLMWVLEIYEWIAQVLAEKGYPETLKTLISNAFDPEERSVEVEISQRSEDAQGVQLEPKCWMVEMIQLHCHHRPQLCYGRILTL